MMFFFHTTLFTLLHIHVMNAKCVVFTAMDGIETKHSYNDLKTKTECKLFIDLYYVSSIVTPARLILRVAIQSGCLW